MCLQVACHDALQHHVLAPAACALHPNLARQTLTTLAATAWMPLPPKVLWRALVSQGLPVMGVVIMMKALTLQCWCQFEVEGQEMVAYADMFRDGFRCCLATRDSVSVPAWVFHFPKSQTKATCLMD